MTRFDAGEPEGAVELDYEQALEALLTMVFFHVGSRQSGFVIRPDEFERGFWRGDNQLALRVGQCAITVLAGGELGRALER